MATKNQTDNNQLSEAGASDLPDDDANLPSDPRAGLTRLSMALIGCKPELSKKEFSDYRAALPAELVRDSDVKQCIVFGRLSGLTGPKDLPNAKPGEPQTTFGLIGQIEAANATTGELFQAGVLYLPGGFHEMFMAEIQTQLESQGGNAMVEFAAEFWSIPAENPRGYSWKYINLLPVRRDDPLASLRRRALAASTNRTPQLTQERAAAPA